MDAVEGNEAQAGRVVADADSNSGGSFRTTDFHTLPKNALRDNSGWARTFSDVVRLSGMGLIGAFWTTFFLTGISFLPFTILDKEMLGANATLPLRPVPVSDPWITAALVGIVVATYSVHCVITTSIRNPPFPSKPWTGVEPALTIALPTTLFIGSLLLLLWLIPPLSLGLTPRFYFLEELALVTTGMAMYISIKVALPHFHWAAKPQERQAWEVAVERVNRIKEELRSENAPGQAPPAGHAIVTERLQPVLVSLATVAQYLPDIAGFVLTLLYLLFMPVFTSDTVDDTARFFIICLLHPFVQEGLLINVRRNQHRRALLLTVLEKADHYHLAVGELGGPTLFAAVFTTLRRFMIGAVKNPTVGIICVVFVGLEQAILRSTTVQRDAVVFGTLFGARAEVSKRLYSAQAAFTTYHEFVAIITSRVAFILFHSHRFVLNLGYNFEDGTEAPIAVAIVIVSMVIELAYEMLVDALSLYVEYQRGIDLEVFWTMLMMSPIWIPSLMMVQSAIAVTVTMWAFASIPNAIFCKSDNPCSCVGGGFDAAFAPFCAQPADNVTSGNQSVSTSSSSAVSVQSVGLFQALGDSTNAVLASIGVIVVTALVFAVGYLLNLLESVKTDAVKAEEEARAREVELRRKHAEIQDKLLAQTLDTTQLAIISRGVDELLECVDASFLCDWREIKYERRLGSGSFGDCYKGYIARVPVAIKKMRVGLIDEEGFEAFKREVVTLSRLDHEHVVSLVGYCLKPVLLIVMDFVKGGTLSAWIKAQKLEDMPGLETILLIVAGTAKGMAYLHSRDPAPILHRDIKSENILLTEKLVPKIADLGEARQLAENKTMTTVGTRGYTAPEVLRGEHYGMPADVYSFAIVISELFSLKPPYEDSLYDEGGNKVATWDQIVEMTKTGLRPELPDHVPASMRKLIVDSWQDNPTLRPSFAVIRWNLKEVIRGLRESGALNTSSKTVTEMLTPGGGLLKNASHLCRSLHAVLWTCVEETATKKNKEMMRSTRNFDYATALAITDRDCKASAEDSVVNEVLSAAAGGVDAIKACGALMFGGFDDGTLIGFEPLVDDDIVISVGDKMGLVTIRFSTTRYRVEVFGSADRKEFRGLKDALAKEIDRADSKLATHMSQRVVKSLGANSFKNTNTETRRRPRHLRRKVKKDDMQYLLFLKAARWVKEGAAHILHPRDKLTLWGLRMQALRGDCERSSLGYVSVDSMKARSWSVCKGMDRRKAMVSYVALLTKISPNWRVASMRSNDTGRSRTMVWRLLVKWKKVQGSRRSKGARGASRKNSLLVKHLSRHQTHDLVIESIRVIQNTQCWLSQEEDNSSSATARTHPKPSSLNLDIQACLFNPAEFKTMEEQDRHFQEQMVAMADGNAEDWRYFGKTNRGRSLEVFSRKVDWSNEEQLKSEVETKDLTVHELWQYVVETFAGADKGFEILSKAHGQLDLIILFSEIKEDSLLHLCFRSLEMPWRMAPLPHDGALLPARVENEIALSKREMYYVQRYLLVDDSWFFTYNHSIDNPRFNRHEGVTRALIKYQGTVCKPCPSEGANGTTNSTRVGCKITWLMNIEFNGSIPSLIIQKAMLDLMSYPVFMCEETKRMKGDKSTLDLLSDVVSNRRFFSETDRTVLKIDDTSKPTSGGKREEGVDQACKGGEGSRDDLLSKRLNVDNFFATLPKEGEITIEDMLIDKAKHSSIKEQDKKYAKAMLSMSSDEPEEGDAWTFVEILKPEMISIWRRNVSWSNVPQYRSRAACGKLVPQDALKLIVSMHKSHQYGFAEKSIGIEHMKNARRKVLKNMGKQEYRLFFEETADGGCFYMDYRIVPFPWPLSDRSLLKVTRFNYVKFAQSVVNYAFSITDPRVKMREDTVCIKMKYQGMVISPAPSAAGSPGGSTFTWLVNFDVGGSIPYLLQFQAIKRLMAAPSLQICKLELEMESRAKSKVDSLEQENAELKKELELLRNQAAR